MIINDFYNTKFRPYLFSTTACCCRPTLVYFTLFSSLFNCLQQLTMIFHDLFVKHLYFLALNNFMLH